MRGECWAPMIISHTHRYIFLKVYKTAGTSVEIALRKHCGAKDVIAPIGEEDEKLREGLGIRGPQNYHVPVSGYGPREAWNRLRYGRRAEFYNHIQARDVRRFIGRKIWDSYYKVCFERNPWDRFISAYYWAFGREPKISITEALESDLPSMMRAKGLELYSIGGEVAVDHVCRYEDLEEEMERFRVRVGIPERLELPRAKANVRTDRRSYREILGEAEREKIAKLFDKEIELFGYEF